MGLLGGGAVGTGGRFGKESKGDILRLGAGEDGVIVIVSQVTDAGIVAEEVLGVNLGEIELVSAGGGILLGGVNDVFKGELRTTGDTNAVVSLFGDDEGVGVAFEDAGDYCAALLGDSVREAGSTVGVDELFAGIGGIVDEVNTDFVELVGL